MTKEKLIKRRKIEFILNLAVTIISIVAVLIMMIASTFLQNVLTGNRKIVFYIIIIVGLLFWLGFVLVDRLYQLSPKEEFFLACSGTKYEKMFYEEYPHPNQEEINTSSDDETTSEDVSGDTSGDTTEVATEVVQEPDGIKEKYVRSRKVKLYTILSNIGDIYSVICIAFLIVSLLFCFVLFPATVQGGCMEPLLYGETTFYEGDKIIALKNGSFDVGDIVVFEYDNSIQKVNSIENGELLIKRVIAKGGQKFECIDGVIYIDDKPLEEEYVHYPYSDSVSYSLNKIIRWNSNFESLDYKDDNIVPEGYYVLLGDNRVVANDSHLFGLVHEDQVCGVVKLYKNDSGWSKIN